MPSSFAHGKLCCEVLLRVQSSLVSMTDHPPQYLFHEIVCVFPQTLYWVSDALEHTVSGLGVRASIQPLLHKTIQIPP